MSDGEKALLYCYTFVGKITSSLVRITNRSAGIMTAAAAVLLVVKKRMGTKG